MKKLYRPEPVKPTFSQADCETFYTPTLTDPTFDNATYSDQPWMAPQPPPSEPFFFFKPSIRNVKEAISRKKSDSAPGPDRISYLVWKKCPSLLPYLCHFYNRVITTSETPDSWKVGNIVLLHKGDDPSKVGNFRPICLSNTIGKIFMGMLARSLSIWLIKSGALDTSWQKGFVPGISGCVEHAALLTAALRDARESGRSLCAVFIDLANAFGSVPMVSSCLLFIVLALRLPFSLWFATTTHVFVSKSLPLLLRRAFCPNPSVSLPYRLRSSSLP